MLEPAPGDLFVRRVDSQCEIRRQHRRDALVAVERVRDARTGALCNPLLRTSRALRKLPFVAVERLEECVVPLGRRWRPDDFETTGDRIARLTAGEAALPAEALVLYRRGLGLRADEVGIARAVRLAERVSADDQRRSLLVIHRHPGERFANVAGGGDGVRRTVRAFRVHVDEAHLYGAER